MTGIPPGPLGSAHRLVAPYRALANAPTLTPWLNIAGLHSRWRELCTMLEISEIADDPRFVSESSRFVNRNALDELLAPRFRTADRDTWISRLRNIGIPCGPINNILKKLMRDVSSSSLATCGDHWNTRELRSKLSTRQSMRTELPDPRGQHQNWGRIRRRSCRNSVFPKEKFAP